MPTHAVVNSQLEDEDTADPPSGSRSHQVGGPSSQARMAPVEENDVHDDCRAQLQRVCEVGFCAESLEHPLLWMNRFSHVHVPCSQIARNAMLCDSASLIFSQRWAECDSFLSEPWSSDNFRVQISSYIPLFIRSGACAYVSMYVYVCVCVCTAERFP